MVQSLELDRNRLEILDRDECLRLLASVTLGRIGFSSGALPTVLPVNFEVDGERILVRTVRGSMLHAALRDAVVAFEADDFDPVRHSGWSVAVTGIATEVGGDRSGASRTYVEPVPRWASVETEVVLAISTDLVTGRRRAAASLPYRD